MTAITNLPDIRPSLLLDFANSGRVDPRIQFTRASSATYFGPDGKLRTVPANVPRIDYDPVMGECRGLLVEEARTNLLRYSELFDNGTWFKFQSSITTNATVAPDGTLTADALIEDTSNNQHNTSQSQTLLANTTYTLSVYVKPAGRSSFTLSGAFVNNWSVFSPAAIFDLMAGTVSGIVGESAGIQPAGNGWYRCHLVCTFGAANASGGINILPMATAVNTVYQGDGASGIYIWGAQLEVGSFPTSYIPTTTSQVTRAADVASMTGASFSDWYRQDEGTIFIDYQLGTSLHKTRALAISDGSNNNTHEAVSGSDSGIGGYFLTTAGGTQQAQPAIGVTNVPFARYVNAYKYKTNSFQAARNGIVSAEDTDGILPVVDRMFIGANSAGGQLGGHIRRIAYYPKQLTNEQLQRITS